MTPELVVHSWTVGMVCNGIIAVAYLLITLAIVVPLARSHQLRTNPLGAATGAIFFTCSVHHGTHALHMLLPSLGTDDSQGLAMRQAWGWPLAIWDVVGALTAAYYWTLRRNYASLMHGAQLFEDLRQRERQALELNDTVLQGLVVAKMALDLNQPERSQEAISSSIEAASRIITDLLGRSPDGATLVRSGPAELPVAPATPTPTPPTAPAEAAAEDPG
jgi:signal transduction histidine kinase